jgi:hypothetical protein
MSALLCSSDLVHLDTGLFGDLPGFARPMHLQSSKKAFGKALKRLFQKVFGHRPASKSRSGF